MEDNIINRKQLLYLKTTKSKAKSKLVAQGIEPFGFGLSL